MHYLSVALSRFPSLSLFFIPSLSLVAVSAQLCHVCHAPTAAIAEFASPPHSQAISSAAVAERRNRGALQFGMMGGAPESIEFGPHAFEVAVTECIDWNPHCDWPKSEEWKGPLSDSNIAKARRHEILGVFKKKYEFKQGFMVPHYSQSGSDVDNLGVQTLKPVWVYKHCRSDECVIIRPVPPAPRIDVWEEGGRCGTRFTAVAAANRIGPAIDICHILITQNERAKEFKEWVKRECVSAGLCSYQSYLTIYYNDALMSSNTVMRNTWRAGPRRVAARLEDVPSDMLFGPGIRSSIWSRCTALCSWKDSVRWGVHNRPNTTRPDQHPWYNMPFDALDFEVFGHGGTVAEQLPLDAAVAEKR